MNDTPETTPAAAVAFALPPRLARTMRHRITYARQAPRTGIGHTKHGIHADETRELAARGLVEILDADPHGTGRPGQDGTPVTSRLTPFGVRVGRVLAARDGLPRHTVDAMP
jgi:hypothetical protein